MSDEASKTKKKFGNLEEIIFKGNGIDIGCGSDPIYDNVTPFDIADGDANEISKYVNTKFDFIFSSHCLEHMNNPFLAIHEWWKLLKKNGYMYIVVPDEDLYEQGVFPSRWNADHKFTFTIYKKKSWSYASINILDLVKSFGNAELVKIELQDDNYDYSLNNIDQTYEKNNINALAQIVFALKKGEGNDWSIYGKYCSYVVDLKQKKKEIYEYIKSIKLFNEARTYLNEKYVFAKEKFCSEKYAGAKGKLLFLTYGVSWSFKRLSSKGIIGMFFSLLKKIKYNIVMLVLKKYQKKEMDWLLIQPNGLGDAVINKFYTDTIIEKNKFSKDKVIIIAWDAWSGFDKILHDNVTIKFINFDKFKTNIFYRISIYLFMSNYSFEYMTCNLKWKDPVVSDSLIKYSFSKNKFGTLGHESDIFYNMYFKNMYDKYGVKNIACKNEMNELERIQFFYESVFNLNLKGLQYKPFLCKFKDSFSNNSDKKYIAFHIGNSLKKRRWGIEKFNAVGEYFHDKGYDIVYTGGNSEKDLINVVPEKFICKINILSCEEYTRLIANASALLVGDTGPAHLGIALKTPTVVLLPGGHYDAYFPYPKSIAANLDFIRYVVKHKECFKCNWNCKYKNEIPCIDELTVEDAISCLNDLLSKNI